MKMVQQMLKTWKENDRNESENVSENLDCKQTAADEIHLSAETVIDIHI